VNIEGPYAGIGFTEPGLSFSLSERSGVWVTLEVSFFKIQLQPPQNPADRTESYSLRMSAADLDRAIVQWDQECSAVLNGSSTARSAD
jgi:hypothetical protein